MNRLFQTGLAILFGRANLTRLFAIIATIFLSSLPAHAYLDAGTGSIIAQLIIGGAAGFMVVVKLYWHKIKSFFPQRKKDNADQPE